MTKEEYLKFIEEIKSDKIFVTDSLNDIDKEIEENCWSISMSKELSREFTVEEIKIFLRDVKADRRQQLKEAKNKNGLIFYLWFDDMAGRLRFNFINAKHKTLPFKASLTFVNEEEILSDFLSYVQTEFQTVKVYKELIM